MYVFMYFFFFFALTRINLYLLKTMTCYFTFDFSISGSKHLPKTCSFILLFAICLSHNLTGARFNKEVQPTLSLNLNSELTYPEMGNSEFSVSEQLNCVSLFNSE